MKGDASTKCFISLRSPTEENSVMPAWIACIRFAGCVRRHPCQSGFQLSMLERRNRVVLLKPTEPLHPIFKGERMI
jgi:hypothetical protein